MAQLRSQAFWALQPCPSSSTSSPTPRPAIHSGHGACGSASYATTWVVEPSVPMRKTSPLDGERDESIQRPHPSPIGVMQVTEAAEVAVGLRAW